MRAGHGKPCTCLEDGYNPISKPSRTCPNHGCRCYDTTKWTEFESTCPVHADENGMPA